MAAALARIEAEVKELKDIVIKKRVEPVSHVEPQEKQQGNDKQVDIDVTKFLSAFDSL